MDEPTTTRHLIIVETPNSQFVPSSNPTTSQVVDLVQDSLPQGVWWAREAVVRSAEETS